MSAVNNTIIISFAWEGPNTWRGGVSHGGLDVRVVDLKFKDAKTKISIHLPQDINPSTAEKYSFTCYRYHDQTEDRNVKPLLKETNPQQLKVTIEQIRNLVIQAGFFEKGRPIGPKIMNSVTGEITQQQTVLKSDRKVELELPEELEIDQTYTLVVTSRELSLSARLIKNEKVSHPAAQEKREASRGESHDRMRKMGEALIREGMQNLELALQGGEGVFDSSSTPADIYAHVMQGVVRACQEMHSDIKVPDSKPAVDSSELDRLTIKELQLRFESTFFEDKKLEVKRIKAAWAGDTATLNRVIQAEFANSQLLITLVEALKRKGVNPQIPQAAGFQSASIEADALYADEIQNPHDACKM
ncbi:MAG: hypothetical protein H7A37_05685 [Chlamydiales bacterium]|nr:hypothetical protein [Chlamydiia bacterium]MCP5507772.1 hypothetical protein [Chlamydiales bacterium]